MKESQDLILCVVLLLMPFSLVMLGVLTNNPGLLAGSFSLLTFSIHQMIGRFLNRKDPPIDERGKTLD
ncbi:MAG TPA: hypothetical protein VNG51_27100 [Ktedonobacteraceae bacterium]|nr:hypothetical protein [Ktedonobacteraceae bacterium]